MKEPFRVSALLSAIVCTAALVGCSSTNLYLEVEGPHVAESVGVEIEELKFITNGDIVETALPDETEGEQVPMEASPHNYSPYTKGVIAVSKERIYWAHEKVERVDSEDFLSVPLTEIEAIQRIEDNALLVRTQTQDIILRPHSWSKYTGDDDRLNMLRTALVDEGVKVIFTMEELAHEAPEPKIPMNSEAADRARYPYGQSMEMPDPSGHFKR